MDDLSIVATPILPGSVAVRMHRRGEASYFANIIASPLDGGREVYLTSHLSTAGTLSHRKWLAAAAEFYPDVKAVLFERLGADGRFTDHRLLL
ncbi:hypothetical protein [Sphingomonas sp. GC_Shp_3]|uniref:hypothetical protein n=1 Tax=Sphingomonas sp. GC_Shp_3 TaxID=2937383 RepID=UPI00226A4556|nr:hypothetical protein [Sphingomonas sp. GC_Shp_3]